MSNEMTAFFDAAAKNWDKTNFIDKNIILSILEHAFVEKGKSVFDAGCGTGVLIPFYLQKGVSEIAALDISGEMLRVAKEKYNDDKIAYICADIEQFETDKKYDCVVVHNAFPHFLNQKAALKNLSALVKDGGTLTVAHSISREQVADCHRNIPHLSVELPEAGTLARMLENEFTDIQYLSDDKMYIVTGIKRSKND
ncbi:MAG: class I SAM-dependent methyltransferase [Clostridia bacterium]|nr:class I SAM-dependent methyltransferase [Clostridia bacterium]